MAFLHWSRVSHLPAFAPQAPVGFAAFQREYLSVHALVMFADWLQGPNMYTLYQSYGMDVGKLFVIGFLSSAVSSSFVGRYVDSYGRKRACLTYCVLEIVINAIEHVPNAAVLAVGRVLGGVSTALLFSAFESWMVTEHRKRRFPEELLPSTFALASEVNGLVAVVAGLVAQITTDHYGDIAPFQVALAVTALAGLMIARWPENVDASPRRRDVHQPHFSRDVVKIGLAYSIYEGAMYNFVFLWVPTMQVLAETAVPTGLVFASFMLCIAIGGKLFALAQDHCFDTVSTAIGIAVLSSACLATPAAVSELVPVFTAFLIFEVCVGAFFPCSATLRAQYFGESQLGTVLGWFRLPTNVLVLLGTTMADTVSAPVLFTACSGLLVLSALCVAGVGRKRNKKVS
ncbi:Major Facilitator Superfamily (MFS) [Achlya hypogyna]|uniref:Molybdate-anion transporter n=1 Tax=Achlya hypogyna TaxID=1202772 RepID=A0A1V9Z3F7_ACHHY|nr:Major Facilitator Superfamily (MFS) [Achlya hypogyna]